MPDSLEPVPASGDILHPPVPMSRSLPIGPQRESVCTAMPAACRLYRDKPGPKPRSVTIQPCRNFHNRETEPRHPAARARLVRHASWPHALSLYTESNYLKVTLWKPLSSKQERIRSYTQSVAREALRPCRASAAPARYRYAPRTRQTFTECASPLTLTDMRKGKTALFKT
jgi:hypothetical protein